MSPNDKLELLKYAACRRSHSLQAAVEKLKKFKGPKLKHILQEVFKQKGPSLQAILEYLKA